MPDHVARFTISLPPDLMAGFDDVSARKGYASRSEAVRDAIRDCLVAHDWSEGGAEAEVAGTLTLVCERAALGRLEQLWRAGSEDTSPVLSALTVPLEDPSYLQVLVLRGRREAVAALADALISARGVKFGRLVCACTGTDLL